MSPEIAVRTQSLNKTFQGGWGRPDVHAVQNLNIEIRRGEIYGLLGPNGSGKTTTIKMLLGLLFPSSGEIEVLGQPPSSVAAKQRIGFLPEESYFYRFLNADETLMFYGRLFGLSKAVIRERAEKLIEMVGLKDARRRPVREYSKGMARRIGLAAALINEPDLIILDEPTSGMDPIGTAEVKDLILKLKSQGTTVLLCSHLLADVESVCDRIAIMYKGILRVSGPVDELLTVKDILQVGVRDLPPERRDELRAALDGMGGRVESFGNARTTLEELFLHTVQEANK